MINGTYLAHWGIKGMHWGVRRYRNPDGTLTEDGKRRYAEKEERIRTKQEAKQPWRTMSDNELRERTNRLNLENNYENALQRNRESSKSKLIKAGKYLVSTLLVASLVEISKEAIKGGLKSSVAKGKEWMENSIDLLNRLKEQK